MHSFKKNKYTNIDINSYSVLFNAFRFVHENFNMWLINSFYYTYRK